MAETVGTFKETDLSQILLTQLEKPVGVLDITDYQKQEMLKIGLDTVGKALKAPEKEFQRILWVGPKRSRRMKNVVVASVLEYLSG